MLFSARHTVNNSTVSLAMLLICTLFSGGCEYYRVVDLQNHQTYYTKGNDWLMRTRNGGVQFEELGTGDEISLTNSRLTKVTKEEAESHIAEPKNAKQ